MGKKERKRFLLKTEASEWSWEDQAANGGISKWDGVKNKQAQKYLKSMSLNDLCFFYHSGPKSRRIVGVVSVIKEWYTEEGNDGAVDVKAVGEMRRAVDLKEMKHMKEFILLKQPRLSVVPVPDHIWNDICNLGDGYHGDEDEEWRCGAVNRHMMRNYQLGNLMESIKSKVRSLKKTKKAKKPYVKIDKSASVKVEIRSRKARKLIDKTLKAAA